MNFSSPFVMFYDSVTTQVRMCCECSVGSAGFARILARFHYDLQEFIGKYCTKVGNELRIS